MKQEDQEKLSYVILSVIVLLFLGVTSYKTGVSLFGSDGFKHSDGLKLIAFMAATSWFVDVSFFLFKVIFEKEKN